LQTQIVRTVRVDIFIFFLFYLEIYLSHRVNLFGFFSSIYYLFLGNIVPGSDPGSLTHCG